MKIVLVLMFLASIALAVPANPKNDKIDLDAIFNNDRLYSKYFECVMGRGKCTPDGKTLKDRLPEVIKENCSKCSDEKRKNTAKAVKFMVDKKSSDYAEFEKMYDPQQTMRKTYT